MPVPGAFAEVDGAEVDLVVVGGGINGAGVAFDAALRGLDTVLFEQGDFGYGTSSRSSKLIHGGLRYLEQLEFRLIYEAVNERRRLRRLARHLVRPLGFHFPRYTGQRPGPQLLRVGLLVYEALVGFRVDGRHRGLGPAQMLAEVPILRREGLRGGVHYYDAKANDARVVWELILGAAQAGAGTFNGVEVVGAERHGDRWHVRVRERETGAEATLRASAVVAAVGAWGDQLAERILGRPVRRIRPTKGIHLVLPTEKLPIRDAVAMTHPRDKRVFFVIPGRGYVYTGTTDTDYEGDLAEPGVTRADVDYLLEALDFHFPAGKFSADDVRATWSGLRPLVAEEGVSASSVSREHEIPEIEPGFFSIEGGKLTTYRVVAEEAVDSVLPHVRRGRPDARFEDCGTRTEPLPGGRGILSEADLDEWTTRLGAALEPLELAASARHLAESYGSRSLELLPWVEAEPTPVLPGLPQSWGELQFIIEQESVQSVEDVLLRRTEIYYQAADNGLGLADEVARRLARQQGRDEAWQTAAVEAWRSRVAAGRAFGQEGA